MKAQVPSKADLDALARLPEGDWFTLRDVPFMVRNPYWRCDRLVELGMLESSVIFLEDNFSTEKRWRKKHAHPL